MNALPTFKSRTMPVVVLDHPDQGVPLARALVAGGIDAIEITLRTPAGLGAIERVAREVPEICVGAGTIVEPADLQRARDAGARFAISPGLTLRLLDAACAQALPFIPGVMTPSEIMTASSAGLKLLKLFPVTQAGGLAMLRALSGPFPDIRFCPTGGINQANAAEYLAQVNVAMVGGIWMTPTDKLRTGDWAGITALALEASALNQPA